MAMSRLHYPTTNDVLTNQPPSSSSATHPPRHPPPSAFRSTAHSLPRLDTQPSPSNPAPTPPPRSPLPALPPSAAPRFEDATSPTASSSTALLNLTISRTPSSARSSWLRSSSSQSELRSWGNAVQAAGASGGETASLSEETVSDAFLLQSLLRHHGHSSLDEWHNRQFGQPLGPVRVTESELGHDDGESLASGDVVPDVKKILAQYQRDLGRQQASQSTPYSRPRSRASTKGMNSLGKKDRRVSPPSASTSSSSIARTPTTPVSPRTSIASDLISLSETSKSLHNLSKRFSGSFGAVAAPVVVNDSRQSLEVFDPFEYDRFTASDDHHPAPSSSSNSTISRITPKARSAGSSPIDAQSIASRAPRRSESSATRRSSSSTKRFSISSSNTQYLVIPPPPPTAPPTSAVVAGPDFPLSRPPMPRSAPASQELIQKSLDLADKRANLEARRAELLGLPPPSRAGSFIQPPMSPSERQTEFPPPISKSGASTPTTASTIGKRKFGDNKPPRLVLHDGPPSMDVDAGRPSTTSSMRSVSSTSTARPGIILRPSTASDGGGKSPMRQEFELLGKGEQEKEDSRRSVSSSAGTGTPIATQTQFSPSSMTFGGDCHPQTRPSSPPPPLPTARPPAVPSKRRDSIPPPPPPKDVIVPSYAVPISPPAASPDIASLLAQRQANRTRSRSSSCIKVKRLAHASSNNSLVRNFSYPTDAAPTIVDSPEEDAGAKEDAEAEEEDEDFFSRSSYYYSHAEGGSLRENGWPEAVPEEDDAAVGGNSSDSSLDLHTPLPDMLVRAGVLSSRSALLITKKDGLGGDVSSAKVFPKTKEQKAAELAKGVGHKVLSRKRLVRHRDGKNLGLGLGLTTGLGWSDSEDEDAPSPLRRHISQVILKKSSECSISTTTSTSTTNSIAGAASRRESILSAERSSTITTTTSTGLTRLRTTNLKGSQSMAQISPVKRTGSSAARQPPPPSSFVLRSGGNGGSSQQSSISSLGSILHPPASTLTTLTLRSPATTSSSTPSPITPATATSDSSSSGSSSSAYSVASRVGLGIIDGATGAAVPSAPMRRVGSSTKISGSGVSTIPAPRSRAGSQANGPPSAYPGGATRQRTNSSSSSHGTSAIPAPRARTTSTGSTTSSATPALKTKSSMASMKSSSSTATNALARSTPPSLHARRTSSTSSSASAMRLPPPPPPVMTVGSLAFPSPPPLSPALVGMRLAQAKAVSRLGASAAQPRMI